MTNRFSLALLCAFVFGVVGCGEDGPPKAELHPVSGKVTVKGKALTGCTIIFSTSNPEPGAAGGYSGELDAEGNYKLQDSGGKPGAAVGKYKVTFSLPPEAAQKAMMAGGDPSKATLPFPKEFQSTETSKKEVEVKAEENVINIEI